MRTHSNRRVMRGLIVGTAALLSVAFLSRERPPIETAYTQDGRNCVVGRVRDQDDKPIAGARVTLLLEASLTGIAATETDPKGTFLFRSVPFKQELMLMVEAEGFKRASVPGITIVPPYSCVVTVRLGPREPAK